MRRLNRSHLTQHLQRQTTRNIAITVIGIVIVIVVAVIYGPSLIIDLSSLDLKTKTPTTSTNSDNTITYVAPPILDDMPSATNSAKVIISGSTEPNARVFLSVNGKEFGATTANADRTFSFHDVTLQQGPNDIKAKTTVKDKDSDYSAPIEITYANKAPSLSIDFPQDGQSFSKDQNPIKVSGKTDPDVRVTVNDFWATSDAQGGFSYLLNLHGGDNQIKVVATDQAGNKTEKDLKVTYSQ